MSVLVVVTVAGDTTTFESFMAASADRVVALTEKAKAAGCLGHRFALGDGQVVVVDEWESAEQFQEFFSSPDIRSVMGEMGAQGEPQFTFAQAPGFPGEF
jgi:heme-degrading monooxygenase HmoA